MSYDLEAHLMRQIAFSRATFGPDERTEGVIDHMLSEMIEILAKPTPEERAQEWLDLAILAFDGWWRAKAAADPAIRGPQIAFAMAMEFDAKQTCNEWRDWPDWRSAPKGRAIEHQRDGAERADKASYEHQEAARRLGRLVEARLTAILDRRTSPDLVAAVMTLVLCSTAEAEAALRLSGDSVEDAVHRLLNNGCEPRPAVLSSDLLRRLADDPGVQGAVAPEGSGRFA